MKKILVTLLLVCFILLPGVAAALLIQLKSIDGFRDSHTGNPIAPLGFLSVKNLPAFEDRTTAHYDIRGLSGIVGLAGFGKNSEASVSLLDSNDTYEIKGAGEQGCLQVQVRTDSKGILTGASVFRWTRFAQEL